MTTIYLTGASADYGHTSPGHVNWSFEGVIEFNHSPFTWEAYITSMGHQAEPRTLPLVDSLDCDNDSLTIWDENHLRPTPDELRELAPRITTFCLDRGIELTRQVDEAIAAVARAAVSNTGAEEKR